MKKDMGGLASKMPITFGTWIVVDGGAVRGAVLQRVLLEGRDHRLRRPLPLRGVLDHRLDRRVHDDRVHDAGDVPDLLRRAARRRRPLRRTSRPRHAEHDAERRCASDRGARRTERARSARRLTSPAIMPRPLPFATRPTRPWLHRRAADDPRLLSLVVSGYLNAAPFKIDMFDRWIESSIGVDLPERRTDVQVGQRLAVDHPGRRRLRRQPGVCKRSSATAASALKGLTQRNPVLGAGHASWSTSTTSTTSTRRSSSTRIAHPIARPRPTGSTSTCSTASSTRVGIGGRRTGDGSTATSTSEWSTARSTAAARSPAAPAARCSPVQSGKVSHVRSAAVRCRSSRCARTRIVNS